MCCVRGTSTTKSPEILSKGFAKLRWSSHKDVFTYGHPRICMALDQSNRHLANAAFGMGKLARGIWQDIFLSIPPHVLANAQHRQHSSGSFTSALPELVTEGKHRHCGTSISPLRVCGEMTGPAETAAFDARQLDTS